MRRMVSDCCKSAWSSWDGFPNCDKCDRVCVLIEKRTFQAPTVKGTRRHV